MVPGLIVKLIPRLKSISWMPFQSLHINEPPLLPKLPNSHQNKLTQKPEVAYIAQLQIINDSGPYKTFLPVI